MGWEQKETEKRKKSLKYTPQEAKEYTPPFMQLPAESIDLQEFNSQPLSKVLREKGFQGQIVRHETPKMGVIAIPEGMVSFREPIPNDPSVIIQDSKNILKQGDKVEWTEEMVLISGDQVQRWAKRSKLWNPIEIVSNGKRQTFIDELTQELPKAA